MNKWIQVNTTLKICSHSRCNNKWRCEGECGRSNRSCFCKECIIEEWDTLAKYKRGNAYGRKCNSRGI